MLGTFRPARCSSSSSETRSATRPPTGRSSSTLGYGAALEESHIVVWPDLIALNLLYVAAIVFSARARTPRAALLRVHRRPLRHDGRIRALRLRQPPGFADVLADDRVRRLRARGRREMVRHPAHECGIAAGILLPESAPRGEAGSAAIIRWRGSGCVAQVRPPDPWRLGSPSGLVAPLRPRPPSSSRTAGRRSRERRNRRGRRCHPRGGLVWRCIVAGVGAHAAFSTGRFDLEIYAQVVWNTAHGQPFATTLLKTNLNHLAEHVALVLIPLSWGYRVWPSLDCS